MGIRDQPIVPGSPWQNGVAESLIGSIRRECVDHLVVLGEAHLRRSLTKYAAHYDELRTHRSLGNDAPIHRAIQPGTASDLCLSSADFITLVAQSNFSTDSRGCKQLPGRQD
jgi:transposase InsO family protein